MRDTKLPFGGRHGAEVAPSLPGGYWVEPTFFLSADNSLRIRQAPPGRRSGSGGAPLRTRG